jgi:phosphonate transport system permease protein
MTPKNNLVIGLVIAGVVVMSYNIGADPVEFVEGIPNLAIVLKEMTEVEPNYLIQLFGLC